MATKTARKQPTPVKFVKRATDTGSYWEAPGAVLNQVLAAVRGLSRAGVKFAAIGGEQEQGFEQAFSSLAYSYLRDKAPRLIDYIVGFQLVDRDEDNTKAVGVFGFKVGKQWLYAPVFFLNGDLKGHELLYVKQQDTFVPMKENWVNYLMSRKPHVLGEGSRQDVYQLGGMAPNIERMSYPPPHSKYGSFDELSEKAAGLMALLGGAGGGLIGHSHGNTAEGIGRGVVRGTGVDLGMGLGGAVGGLTGGALGGLAGPAGIPLGAGLGGAAGALLGGYGGWKGTGAALGDPSWEEKDKKKEKKSGFDALAEKAAAALRGERVSTEKAAADPDGIAVPGGRLQTWVIPFLPVLGALAGKQANFMWKRAPAGAKLDLAKLAADPYKAALADTGIDLEEFLCQDIRLANTAYETSRRYPGIKAAFDKFHGADFFTRIGRRIKQAALETDSSLIETAEAPSRRDRYARMRARRGEDINGSLLKESQSAEDDKKPKVTIVTDPDVAVTKNLDIEDKKKLLHHGYLVKDERKGDELSQAYNTQVRIELTNPGDTGLYEVLEKPGTFERMLIVSNPVSNAGSKDFCTVVRLGDGEKKWLNGHRTALFARKVELDADYRDWFDGLGGRDTLAKGGTYLAINDRGEGTVPFEVRKIYDDGSYTVDFKGYEDWKAGRPSSLPRVSYNPDSDVSEHNALVTVNDRPGSRLKSLAGVLHVPDNFKFLKLKDAPKPEKPDEDDGGGYNLGCCKSTGDPDGWDSDGSDPRPIQPGDISDVQLLFSQKTAEMKLWGDQSEVVIQTEKRGRERLTWRQGLFSLIRHHGFDEKTAGEMLRQVQVKAAGARVTPTRFRVKYAGYYPDGDLQSGGPYAPVMPSPEYGSEPIGYNSVNAIYPQTDFLPVPGMDSSRTDPRIYDPFLMPDSKAVQTAQQAGQEGQKEVFDTSIIAGMLRSGQSDTQVDRQLPPLMKAIDALGRLLMNFYWHQDQWADRYGKESLPDIEDGLRNTFESAGDIVLDLKQKSVEPDLDTMSDPSMEDAARN